MNFKPSYLAGAWFIRTDRNADSRGSFERTYDAEEFAAHGIHDHFTMGGLSRNGARGTVRGLHFQWPPMAQAKLVRCVRGAMTDILLDLRPDSHTFMQHQMVTLDALYGTMVFIPPGFAHGFQTQEHDTYVEYLISGRYSSQLADGFCWNDPAFGIKLPNEVTVIGERDASYPRFDPHAYKSRFSI